VINKNVPAGTFPVDAALELPTLGQQQADALALLAETVLHHGIEPGAPGERYQVVVHVDAPVLADPDGPGQSVLEDGTHVSAETSRRLACDASRVVMRHDPDGRVSEVGARTRTIPPALRRVLQHRDRGCRFPGCGLRFGQGHHIRHWAQGGPTASCASGARTAGYCRKSRLRLRCPPIPSTRCEPTTTRAGSTFTRGRRCLAGSASISM
jgi:hypothetical protein